MNPQMKYGFLAIVVAQAMHSTEEYLTRLFEVFAPARFISSLLTDDLQVGFLIVNSAVVLIGVWCYLFRVRPGHKSAVGWMWFWIIFEGANGIGHVLLALSAGEYFPGLMTAPALIAASAYLAWKISDSGSVSQNIQPS